MPALRRCAVVVSPGAAVCHGSRPDQDEMRMVQKEAQATTGSEAVNDINPGPARSNDNLPPPGRILPHATIRQYRLGRIDGAGDLAAEILELASVGGYAEDFQSAVEVLCIAAYDRHQTTTDTGLLP